MSIGRNNILQEATGTAVATKENLSPLSPQKKFLRDAGTLLFGGSKVISSFALALVFAFTFVAFFNFALAIPVIIALGLVLAFANSITTALFQVTAFHGFINEKLVEKSEEEPKEKCELEKSPYLKKAKKNSSNKWFLYGLVVITAIGTGITSYFGIVKGVASIGGLIVSGSIKAPIVAMLMTNPILLAIAGILTIGGAVTFLCLQIRNIDNNANKFSALFTEGSTGRKILLIGVMLILFAATALYTFYKTTNGVNGFLFGVSLTPYANIFSSLTWAIGPILFVPTIIINLFTNLYGFCKFIFPSTSNTEQPSFNKMWNNYLSMPLAKKITYPILMVFDILFIGTGTFVSAIAMLSLVGLGTPAALVISPWLILALGLTLINVLLITPGWYKIFSPKAAVENQKVPPAETLPKQESVSIKKLASFANTATASTGINPENDMNLVNNIQLPSDCKP